MGVNRRTPSFEKGSCGLVLSINPVSVWPGSDKGVCEGKDESRIMKAEEPWSWLVGVLVILWVGQTVFVLVLGRHFHVSRILETSK